MFGGKHLGVQNLSIESTHHKWMSLNEKAVQKLHVVLMQKGPQRKDTLFSNKTTIANLPKKRKRKKERQQSQILHPGLGEASRHTLCC